MSPFRRRKAGVERIEAKFTDFDSTLLYAGKAQPEIARVLGVDPRTVRRIEREAKCPGVATGSKPVAMPSACEVHREWIDAQALLGRNAMSIY